MPNDMTVQEARESSEWHDEMTRIAEYDGASRAERHHRRAAVALREYADGLDRRPPTPDAEGLREAARWLEKRRTAPVRGFFKPDPEHLAIEALLEKADGLDRVAAIRARVELLEAELTQIAALLQDALIIGQVRHVGLLDCAYALRQLLAHAGGQVGHATEADAQFFDGGADEYIEKANTQHGVDQETRTVYLAIARMNRDAAKALRFASKHMACERFDAEPADAD